MDVVQLKAMVDGYIAAVCNCAEGEAHADDCAKWVANQKLDANVDVDVLAKLVDLAFAAKGGDASQALTDLETKIADRTGGLPDDEDPDPHGLISETPTPWEGEGPDPREG